MHFITFCLVLLVAAILTISTSSSPTERKNVIDLEATEEPYSLAELDDAQRAEKLVAEPLTLDDVAAAEQGNENEGDRVARHWGRWRRRYGRYGGWYGRGYGGYGYGGWGYGGYGYGYGGWPCYSYC